MPCPQPLDLDETIRADIWTSDTPEHLAGHVQQAIGEYPSPSDERHVRHTIAPDPGTGPMLYTALIVLRPGHDENRPGTSTPSTPVTDRSPRAAVGIAHGSAIPTASRTGPRSWNRSDTPPLSNSAEVAQAARTKKAAGALPHSEDPTVRSCTCPLSSRLFHKAVPSGWFNTISAWRRTSLRVGVSRGFCCRRMSGIGSGRIIWRGS